MNKLVEKDEEGANMDLVCPCSTPEVFEAVTPSSVVDEKASSGPERASLESPGERTAVESEV